MSKQTIEVEVPDCTCPRCKTVVPLQLTRVALEGHEWVQARTLFPDGWGYASNTSPALYCGGCLNALKELLTANGFSLMVRDP